MAHEARHTGDRGAALVTAHDTPAPITSLLDVSFVRERAIESDETLRKRVADWDGWLGALVVSPNDTGAFRMLEDYRASGSRRGGQSAGEFESRSGKLRGDLTNNEIHAIRCALCDIRPWRKARLPRWDAVRDESGICFVLCALVDHGPNDARGLQSDK